MGQMANLQAAVGDRRLDAILPHSASPTLPLPPLRSQVLIFFFFSASLRLCGNILVYAVAIARRGSKV